jgi:phospholipase C
LPETKAVADRAHAIPKQPNPAPPAELKAAVQTTGPRPSRALPYALEVDAQVDNGAVVLRFLNSGPAGAVFHVYDRRKLQDIPRRYTVGAGAQSQGSWQGPEHDLWVIGPNGFHRHVRGAGGPDTPAVTMTVDKAGQRLTLTYSNPSSKPCVFTTTPMAYGRALALQTFTVPPQGKAERSWSLAATRGWYDLTATCGLDPRFERRFAGRAENGKDSISDPAMGGPAILYRA